MTLSLVILYVVFSLLLPLTLFYAFHVSSTNLAIQLELNKPLTVRFRARDDHGPPFKRETTNGGVVLVHARSRQRLNAYVQSYGVRRVDPNRTKSLGFLRRLLRYERVDVINVPEISHDTVRCDDWNVLADVSKLVRCRINEGLDACFRCLESRAFVRVCVNIPYPLDVYLNADTDDALTIPANANDQEGYCLSRAFQRMINSNGSWRPDEQRRNCNPNTGDWLLTRLLVNGDSTYNWICRCRYPNLMTNVDTLLSDCLKPVGCLPHGRLNDETSAGLVNPYTNGACICKDGYRPDRDERIGPICLADRAISDVHLPQSVYREHNLDLSQALKWPADRDYLDSRLATIFGNTNETALLPNPCKYDVRTGTAVDDSYACDLVRHTITGFPTAFCVSKSSKCIAVRTDRDYLLNNNGTYANACLCLDSSDNESAANMRVSILSYQNSLRVDTNQPDFGLLFPPEKSTLLSELFDKATTNDNDYAAFSRNVDPPLPYNNKVEQKFPLFGDDNTSMDWFSIYEETPTETRKMFGLKEAVISSWSSRRYWSYVAYNAHDRETFWLCIKNPYGSEHWQRMTRDEIADFVPYASSANADWQYEVGRKVFRFEIGQEKPIDFLCNNDNWVRLALDRYPRTYPGRQIYFPFYTGGIDNHEMSLYGYPSIYPIFKAPEIVSTRIGQVGDGGASSPAAPFRYRSNTMSQYLFRSRQSAGKQDDIADKPVMPFVYNTKFDEMGSTLTLHLHTRPTEPVTFLYLCGDRAVGTYRSSNVVMKNQLQGRFV